jgi:outer membrane receptor protein involved in Fe transport
MGGFKAALVCGTILAGGMGHVASAAEAVPDNGALVGEIVITGQKRTSTVQNTAATINVISAETLQASGVTGTASLQFATPGLLVSQDLGLQTQIFIRGIGSNLQGIGTGNSVATYIDGVFIPNSIASAQQFTDVERVEVLKGPQATLYGRNATGGALSIVTADPKFDLSGAADVSYGNYNAISTHVKVNIPLVADRLALSLATQTTKHDGYVRNLFRNTRLAYEDVQGVRGALKAVLNDDVDVVLRADYTDILESDVYKVTPSTSYYYLTPPSTLANPVPNYFAPDAREVYYNTDNRNPGRDSGISGALHWKTPIGSVTSVTSERYFNAGPIVADNDQTPLYSLIFGTSIDTTGARQSSDSFYHETYLTSDIPGPLKFVGGQLLQGQGAPARPVPPWHHRYHRPDRGEFGLCRRKLRHQRRDPPDRRRALLDRNQGVPAPGAPAGPSRDGDQQGQLQRHLPPPGFGIPAPRRAVALRHGDPWLQERRLQPGQRPECLQPREDLVLRGWAEDAFVGRPPPACEFGLLLRLQGHPGPAVCACPVARPNRRHA